MMPPPPLFPLRSPQVNSVNCNTSWKIVLFMKWSDNKEIILKGVGASHTHVEFLE